MPDTEPGPWQAFDTTGEMNDAKNVSVQDTAPSVSHLALPRILGDQLERKGTEAPRHALSSSGLAKGKTASLAF